MVTLAVLLFALLSVGSAAPRRQRRQTTITAEVMPIAEDHFDEGRTVHACHVMPNDGSEPYKAVRVHTPTPPPPARRAGEASGPEIRVRNA